jgi:hypothetical protein
MRISSSDRKFSVSVSVSAEISVSVWVSVSVSVWFKLSVSAEISVQNATENRNMKTLFPNNIRSFLRAFYRIFPKSNRKKLQFFFNQPIL